MRFLFFLYRARGLLRRLRNGDIYTSHTSLLRSVVIICGEQNIYAFLCAEVDWYVYCTQHAKSIAMKVKTGKGEISLVVLVAILSVSAIVSLPGLAISPILDDLDKIFPRASELEVEMLESLPSLMIIPFMLFAGGWSIRGNKIRLLVVGTTIFLLSGIGSLLARSLMELIVLGAIMGVGAGLIIPLSTSLIVDYFVGEYRVKQLGISSAINNLTLVIAHVRYIKTFMALLLMEHRRGEYFPSGSRRIQDYGQADGNMLFAHSGYMPLVCVLDMLKDYLLDIYLVR